MLTWVMGLPVPLCTGMALMSRVEVLIAGRSAPVGFVSSGLGGAAFDVVLVDMERCGMSLMLLYFGCL